MGKDKLQEQLDAAKTELFDVVNSLSEKIKETEKTVEQNVQSNSDNISRLNRLIESALNRVERITETIAQRTANKMLDQVNLGDDSAAQDIHEIRQWHKNRKTLHRDILNSIWTLVVRTAIIMLLTGIFLQQRGITLKI